PPCLPVCCVAPFPRSLKKPPRPAATRCGTTRSDWTVRTIMIRFGPNVWNSAFPPPSIPPRPASDCGPRFLTSSITISVTSARRERRSARHCLSAGGGGGFPPWKFLFFLGGGAGGGGLFFCPLGLWKKAHPPPFVRTNPAPPPP